MRAAALIALLAVGSVACAAQGVIASDARARETEGPLSKRTPLKLTTLDTSRPSQTTGRQPSAYVQPGCTVMFLPGQPCISELAPGARGCCVPSHRCDGDGAGGAGVCQPVPAGALTYDFAASRGAVAGAADAYAAGRALQAAAAASIASIAASPPPSSPSSPGCGTAGGVDGAAPGCRAAVGGADGGPALGAAAPLWCSARRLLPGGACDPLASPAVECCPDGYACAGDGGGDEGGFRCRLAVTASAASAATEPLSPTAASEPALRAAIAATASALRAAAPADADADAAAAETSDAAARAAAAAAAASPAAAARAAASLSFPPPPLPADACSCRVDAAGLRVPAPCPSAWDLAAAGADGSGGHPPAVLPALRVDSASGLLVQDPPNAATAPPLARLRGLNWFGWETGQKNFDGLWSFCDDGYGPACPPGPAQIPPWFEGAKGGGPIALAPSDRDRLKAYAWGRRTATNDFAGVVHAIKALGFNAVRVPFTFSELAAPLPPAADGAGGRAPPEYALCLNDDLEELNFRRLADPSLDLAALRAAVAAGGGRAAGKFPRYAGAPHPPPARFWPSQDDPERRAACDLPWEAPMRGGYADPSRDDPLLRLTTCNWYLPQAPGTAAIHRFLFEIEYLVSQGLYVLLSYHPTAPRDAAAADAALFASNWGALWRSLAALPSYPTRLRGRVFADLLNEGSRYGCLWERAAVGVGGATACAPAAAAFTAAFAQLHAADPLLPGVFANGLGQSGAPRDVSPGGGGDCVAAQTCFRGMPWGDGFITKRSLFSASRGASLASNASSFFAFSSAAAGGSASSSSGPPSSAKLGKALALSPHIYPGSITGWPPETRDALFARLNASFGWKAAGRDLLWSGRRLTRRPPVLLGEVGVADDGDNGFSAPNADTTRWRPEDLRWLGDVRAFFAQRFLRVPAVPATRRVPVGRAASGHPLNFFVWSWNANSGDTKGLVGPASTWRAVQWTKIRALAAELALRPWYCDFLAGSNPAAAAGACGGGGGAAAAA